MELRQTIREYYGERVVQGEGCCGPAQVIGDLEVPSYGCGEPTKFAELRRGETVLDLGSGAGLDCFRAAEGVGPEGRVIGVDMTPEMLERARSGAEKLGLSNVEFREGYIEALPVEDGRIDVVISNCVVNLSADKAKVFVEAFRVLAPGGRVMISDVLRHGPRLTAASEEGWCACIDGAEPPEVYRELLEKAGFSEIEIDLPSADVRPGETYSALVRAVKPPLREATGEDLEGVRALLKASGLPTEGLEATELFVLEQAGHVVGVVGFERYGPYALLRSLAVSPELRGQGQGRQLLRFVLNKAAGFKAVYGLTTTIPEWLLRLGFTEMTRDDLPQVLHASAELKGACPVSARVFGLELL